eukprot:2061197-Amphidinium_carterae.1
MLELDNEAISMIAASLRVLLSPACPLRSDFSVGANGGVIPSAALPVHVHRYATEVPTGRLYMTREWFRHPDLPLGLIVRRHGSPPVGGIL